VACSTQVEQGGKNEGKRKEEERDAGGKVANLVGALYRLHGTNLIGALIQRGGGGRWSPMPDKGVVGVLYPGYQGPLVTAQQIWI
jgi:hypothetical protein